MNVIQVEPLRRGGTNGNQEELTQNQFPEIDIARGAFLSGRTLPIKFRRQQLLKLQRIVHDESCIDRICEALYKDMRRSRFEAREVDVHWNRIEIQTLLKNLKKLTSPKTQARNLILITDTARVRYEPRGVVLIIGPWNVPFYCTFSALAGAIAAGNCVIVKPSEIALHSSLVILELIRENLDNSCYHVVLGDADRTKALLTHRFDYIFFTGSTTVGRHIMQAAAKHLTPVTLELGGKSPVYIDQSACTKTGVKRIIWGKCWNLGQTCVAPDYIICSKEVQQTFLLYAKEIFKEMYGTSENLQRSPEFARIINVNNFRRLNNLLRQTKGTVLFGGNVDEKDLWIEPTFIGDIQANDILLQEEIFGPILPFVTASTTTEAIEFMRSLERPLALYIFSKEKKIVEKILDSVPSGGVLVNDIHMHLSDPRIPFGGNGMSRMGQYHGKYSFETFSHQRAVVTSGMSYFIEKGLEIRYPPESSMKLKALSLYTRVRDSFNMEFGFKFRVATYLIAIYIGYVLSDVVSNN